MLIQHCPGHWKESFLYSFLSPLQGKYRSFVSKASSTSKLVSVQDTLSEVSDIFAIIWESCLQGCNCRLLLSLQFISVFYFTRHCIIVLQGLFLICLVLKLAEEKRWDMGKYTDECQGWMAILLSLIDFSHREAAECIKKVTSYRKESIKALSKYINREVRSCFICMFFSITLGLFHVLFQYNFFLLASIYVIYKA